MSKQRMLTKDEAQAIRWARDLLLKTRQVLDETVPAVTNKEARMKLEDLRDEYEIFFGGGQDGCDE